MDRHREIIKGLIKRQKEDIKRFDEWEERESKQDNICLKFDYFNSQATHSTINKMVDNNSVEEFNETIEKLKDEARNSWSGKVGEERAKRLEKYLRNKLEEYSNVLNISQKELLEAWEKDRDYLAINYYQECNQPTLKEGKVRVFKNKNELIKTITVRKFRCPYCGGISDSPYVCNNRKHTICGCGIEELITKKDKCTFVYCKEEGRGEFMFTPVCWEEE